MASPAIVIMVENPHHHQSPETRTDASIHSSFASQ